jgi:hypothetical protein
MQGFQLTYRITPATTTFLTQTLTATADIVHVADASALTLPVLSYNQWGVLTVDGERIMYRERDLINNTVSSLIRGTAGTAATEHAVDSAVYNMSRSNLLPTESATNLLNRLPDDFQNYVVSNLTNNTEIYPILGNGVNTVFVAAAIDATLTDSTSNDESIEVYLGGIRQYTGYTITDLDPVIVEFDTAPPAGIQVTILVRRGVWWYDIATPAEREQSLQETPNAAARFLRGQ